MPAFGSYEENALGASQINTNFWPDPVRMLTPDPERSMVLVPEPPAGVVRVPIYAAVQADGPTELVAGQPPETVTIPIPFISCHGRLERTGNAFDAGVDVSAFLTTSPYNGSSGTCLLWSMRLTPPVLVGGEFFLPVSAFPIVRGTTITANWSYATAAFNGQPAYNVRTRAVWVDVPIGAFDWSRVQPLPMQPKQTTV